jgi:hypothetical protein
MRGAAFADGTTAAPSESKREKKKKKKKKKKKEKRSCFSLVCAAMGSLLS